MRHLVLVLLVLAASPSYADHPRYTRKPELKLDVTPSVRVKPIQPAPAAPRAPAVTADDVLRIQERAAPFRHEQEVILLQLIRDTPDSDPDKPDYFFRLAEQYAGELRFWRLKAVEADLAAH